MSKISQTSDQADMILKTSPRTLHILGWQDWKAFIKNRDFDISFAGLVQLAKNHPDWAVINLSEHLERANNAKTQQERKRELSYVKHFIESMSAELNNPDFLQNFTPGEIKQVQGIWAAFAPDVKGVKITKENAPDFLNTAKKSNFGIEKQFKELFAGQSEAAMEREAYEYGFLDMLKTSVELGIFDLDFKGDFRDLTKILFHGKESQTYSYGYMVGTDLHVYKFVCDNPQFIKTGTGEGNIILMDDAGNTLMMKCSEARKIGLLASISSGKTNGKPMYLPSPGGVTQATMPSHYQIYSKTKAEKFQKLDRLITIQTRISDFWRFFESERTGRKFDDIEAPKEYSSIKTWLGSKSGALFSGLKTPLPGNATSELMSPDLLDSRKRDYGSNYVGISLEGARAMNQQVAEDAAYAWGNSAEIFGTKSVPDYFKGFPDLSWWKKFGVSTKDFVVELVPFTTSIGMLINEKYTSVISYAYGEAASGYSAKEDRNQTIAAAAYAGLDFVVFFGGPVAKGIMKPGEKALVMASRELVDTSLEGLMRSGRQFDLNAISALLKSSGKEFTIDEISKMSERQILQEIGPKTFGKFLAPVFLQSGDDLSQLSLRRQIAHSEFLMRDAERQFGFKLTPLDQFRMLKAMRGSRIIRVEFIPNEVGSEAADIPAKAVRYR
ncbi:Uncharacterised protein [Candidatus Gugararchaeum adminiculabundum]|nr:Uncharacterised protein [Candidatus Gugararchaeum adminiculabundum]